VAHRELQKTSRVRRSDQGKGAKEPDLVIQGCPCWHELQRAQVPDPRGKLAQAEQDAAAQQTGQYPVAIVSKTGSPKDPIACLRLSSALALEGWSSDEPLGVFGETIIEMNLADYLRILRDHEERTS
jgi:hypothetical protein